MEDLSPSGGAKKKNPSEQRIKKSTFGKYIIKK
jgi:hypothetical protein